MGGATVDVMELDGLGRPIDPGAEYYVQDARGVVGNCASWWRAKGAGYACDLSDAGIYKGSDVRSMRTTDVPWPVAWVRERTIQHVRADLFPPIRWRTHAVHDDEGRFRVLLDEVATWIKHNVDDDDDGMELRARIVDALAEAAR